MAIRVGINGFGRIGRMVLRAAQDFSDVEVVGINDLLEPEYLAYMLKHDSVHGRFNGTVEADGNNLVVNGKKIEILSERDPSKLPWRKKKVEVVLESTGVFRVRSDPKKGGIGYGSHLDAGAKKIRSWTFDTDGGVSEGVWTKQGDQWHVRKKGTTADGELVTALNILTYVDDGAFKFRSVQRSMAGDLLPNVDEVLVLRQ